MEMPAEYIRKNNTKTVDRDIVICPQCRGEGHCGIEADDPSYNGPWVEPCWVCGGTGRMVRKVTTELSRLS